MLILVIIGAAAAIVVETFSRIDFVEESASLIIVDLGLGDDICVSMVLISAFSSSLLSFFNVVVIFLISSIMSSNS